MIGVARTFASNSYINNNPLVALRRYRNIPNGTARKIAWVGDSTTTNLFNMTVGGYTATLNSSNTGAYYSASFNYPGGPFYNVTNGNYGSNGNTAENFIAGTISGASVSDIAAFDPDLIVFCYGINDVRTGITTKDQLKTRITTAVQLIQAACPDADIILRMPNSLLYDSGNTGSYIDAPVSLSKVQDYSDRLRLAYRELIDSFSNVYVLDTQDGDGQLFLETSTTLVNKGFYMSDALHPSGEGNAAMLREIILAIGDYGDTRFTNHALGLKPLLPVFSKYLSKQATAISSSTDYLFYPRVCEDTDKYNLIFEGLSSGGLAGSYFDISTNGNIAAKNYAGAFVQDDIVVEYNSKITTSGGQNEIIDSGVCAWKYTGNNETESGDNIRLLGCPSGYPKADGTVVRIFRARPSSQKYSYDPDFSVSLAAADFTNTTLLHVVQRFGVAAVISATATTGPTTGGTIDFKKNGTTFATITFANNGTTGTVSGTFVGSNTKGICFDESDIITAVVNVGFVGGSGLKIKISNK